MICGVKQWATVVAVVVAGLVATTLYVDNVNDRFTHYAAEIAREERDRRVEDCRVAAATRRVLRQVIISATPMADEEYLDLPDDPAVDPAVIAYLERIINQQQTINGATVRERLLEAAPPIRCTSEGFPRRG